MTEEIKTKTSDELINDSLSEEEVRREKLKELRAANIEPFAYKFDTNTDINQITLKYENDSLETPPEDSFKVAGRLMAKRGHGKAFFGNISDQSGSIQFYANVQLLGEETYNLLMSFDVGDIIGVEATIFRTKRGELSLKPSSITLLTKALKPLPEKYHGLQNKELRYRKRYVDLIVNQDVRRVFETRSKVIKLVRDYLSDHSFMEVETPVLHSIYGGASARPFETFHNELGQKLYLRIALELHLKRLLVGGFEKVFEIGRVFRNEGVSFKHNPEYTLLELYQAYADYNDIMELTENLISSVIKSIHGTYKIIYQEKEIDFTPPFKRLTLNDALIQFAGISMTAPETELRLKAKSLGLENSEEALKGQLINFIYDKCVEDELIQPVFITDYPWETSPLAKKKRDNKDLVERFELIVNGMELANAFSELNDPDDQYDRFMDQVKARESGDDEAHQMDEDFVNALQHGMPPAGGLGIGIDRIVMLATNAASIRDVLFFPHMRT